jgi:hypothetical protein
LQGAKATGLFERLKMRKYSPLQETRCQPRIKTVKTQYDNSPHLAIAPDFPFAPKEHHGPKRPNEKGKKSDDAGDKKQEE